MSNARRETIAVAPEHEDVWEETVGKTPPDKEGSWTFDEFKHAMWKWLNFKDAPEYFSANDLADGGLPRMKHLGKWLAEIAKLGWIDRPTTSLAGLNEVFYCVETNNPTNRSVVTVWRNLRPSSRGLTYDD
jgi:hypothetical protein